MSIVFLLGFVGACGGGGDDNAVTFIGETAQALVTTTNTPEIAPAALSNGILSASSTSVIGRGASSTVSRRVVGDFVNQMVTQKLSLAEIVTVSRVVVGPETDFCSGGGTVTATLNINENTGVFSAIAALNNCTEDGITSNGNLTFSGSVDLVSFEFDSPLLFTFGNLSISDNDAADITISGTMECDVDNPSMSSCTQNFDVLNNVSDEIFRLENYQIVETPISGGTTISISGKFYHPEHGFVELITDTDMFVGDSDEWPTSGVIRLIGLSNSSARITMISTTQFMLEVDSDGDSTYESSTIESWPA
ncbi:MAG: hypothetical protein HKM24_04870 [Gammaproteobacteria bacterium]|nr:hypothetical protein [Gammaproteobacteria bacterium]